MPYKQRNDVAEVGFVLSSVFTIYLMILIGIILLGYLGDKLYLSLNTAEQPTVRTNIINQASRVIATQAEMIQDCADIKTDAANVYLAHQNLANFVSSHDMKHLGFSDSQTNTDLSTNLTGVQVALTDLENTYDGARSNPDNNVNLTVSLPTTYKGCL